MVALREKHNHTGSKGISAIPLARRSRAKLRQAPERAQAVFPMYRNIPVVPEISRLATITRWYRLLVTYSMSVSYIFAVSTWTMCPPRCEILVSDGWSIESVLGVNQ